jgi:hypothetical protein
MLSLSLPVCELFCTWFRLLSKPSKKCIPPFIANSSGAMMEQGDILRYGTCRNDDINSYRNWFVLKRQWRHVTDGYSPLLFNICLGIIQSFKKIKMSFENQY